MENTICHPLRWKAVIPHLVVVLWLIYLGAMIWQHAVQSLQVPLYDPLSYMQKAMNFWKAVDQGEMFNPLNIEPTVRPPGTILMSYPFGFKSDFKGFYFRSVFSPILCVVIAVYVSAGTPRSSRSGWDVAAVAILFSAIPMFYHFDGNEINPGPSSWGLVDNFQAGIAAMAAAGFIKSLKTRSLLWLFFGTFWGSFTLLVKPSGLMVMALLAIIWFVVVTVEWIWERKHDRSDSNLPRYVIIGGIQSFVVYTIIVLFCFFSKYFSIQNYVFAKHALSIMKDILKVSLYDVSSLLLGSVGIALVVWILLKGILFTCYCFSGKDRHDHDLLSAKMVGMLLSAPVVWGLGAWYWLGVQAGGNQVRYFHPFFLMGAICLIPMSMHVIQHTHLRIRLAELVLCFLAALNIGALLMVKSPSIQWQRVTGVNVTVGKDREEVNQAYHFLEELRRRDIRPRLYAFISGAPTDIFVTVGLYEGMVRPDLPVFKPILSADWERGFHIRKDQLLDADYILVRNDLDRIAKSLIDRQSDMISEYVVFQTWLCGLDGSAGVKTVSAGRALRLLEIIDIKAFEVALETFVATHSWSPEFMAGNSQRRWFDEKEVSEYAGNLAVKEIGFEGIYTLQALSLGHSDSGLKVEIWWEEMRHENMNRQWYMFFHLVDQSGKILCNLSLPLGKYSPPSDNRRWRYGSLTFEHPLPSEATALAFGIFHPDHEFLMPDKGVRDWGGKRVVLPLGNMPVSTS